MTEFLKQTSARTLPALRLEHLWALLAIGTVSAFISLTPSAPNDFWWHLKAGELVATSGIPTSNMFAWTLPADHPYVYQSWLGEWLFYALYRLGGLPMTVFGRNMLGTLAYGLVAIEAQRRSGSWRLAALATLLAGAMTLNNFMMRTQNWSWVPFVVIFSLLGRYVDGKLRGRWLIALPLIMIFWVNTHGAFVMGLLVTGAFVVGETARRLLRQAYALSWQRLQPLYLALGGMFIALLINPLGIGVIGYLRTLLSDNSSQQLIVEWQSPTPRDLAGGFFYGSVLGVIAVFAFGRRRPTITDVILICGLAWQAFIGVRYVTWFGMVAMPILAQSLARPRPVLGSVVPGLVGRERGGGSVANLLAAGLIVLLTLTTQPWLKPLMPLPQPYRDLFVTVAGTPLLFSVTTPVRAVEHLREQPCDGNIFNEMGYGSYMAWALYPEAQSFIDPRVELFPFELWTEYIEITNGRGLEASFERHAISCVLLDLERQPKLATAMVGATGWQRSFGDGQSEVWRTTNAR